MNVTTLGIDLAKAVFQLHGVDERGAVVVQERLSRQRVLPFLANRPPCGVGLEACGGAHYWARQIQTLGPAVKLIAPQFVTPYRQGHQTDRHDAAALCEAVSRPHMRFVAAKTIEQQDLQTVHRVREQLVKNRTALANPLRSVRLEYGIGGAQGLGQMRRALPLILEEAQNGLTDLGREGLHELYQRLHELDTPIKHYDQRLARLARPDEVCQRLRQVEGVGPITATALRAAVGDAQVFHNGRQFAAWLGLTPQPQSSGGKVVMLGISKGGNRSLRKLLIQGARTVVKYAPGKQQDARSVWINRVRERRGVNGAAVALANQHARILWALLAPHDAYRPAI